MKLPPRILFFLLVVAAVVACGRKSEISRKSYDKDDFKIIAYYTPWTGEIAPQKVKQLDQIIYSFLYLKDNRLDGSKKNDSTAISYLKSLKVINPDLKILISLGGWGGCETCSEVFSTPEGRAEFAASVKDLLEKHKIDGIDLDWEYPAVPGYPGHPYKPEDRENFTLLVQELRKSLGEGKLLTFAAGSSRNYVMQSVEWNKVMPLVDGVNVMTYDFVTGAGPVTGHHTALYSTGKQQTSADAVVQLLDSVGVPREKIVLGAAFYARIWKDVPSEENGLYQKGEYKETLLYKDLSQFLSDNDGFQKFWDPTARASYLYHPSKKMFVSYDDSLSVRYKSQYVVDHGLGGIMFWQIAGDEVKNGLLEVISEVRQNN